MADNTDQQAQGGLLSLPPEIRMSIFELLVPERVAILPHMCTLHRNDNSAFGIKTTDFNNLFSVCRKVSREALALYYAKTSFSCKIDTSWVRTIRRSGSLAYNSGSHVDAKFHHLRQRARR